MGKGEQVSEAMQSLVAQLTRERLTPLMKESFLCCAECCDNEDSQERLQAWYDSKYCKCPLYAGLILCALS